MNIAPPPTILLVEDNSTTARMLVLFLEDAGHRVECASDGEEALTLFGRGSFDLIVLDLMLPRVDGIRVCKTVRKTSAVPIVMLTAKSSEEDIVNGLEAGADDYVTKPFASKVLLARIRSCLRRQGKLDPQQDAGRLLRVGGIEIDVDRRLAKLDDKPLKLTKTEFDILHTLLRRPDRVFTRSQLIQQAMGENFEGFDRSVDTHIWSLRKKLREPRGNPKYILSEPGVGYRLNDQYEN